MITHQSVCSFLARPLFAVASSLLLTGASYAAFESTDFSTTDPAWSTIVGGLAFEQDDPGPIKGTGIDVPNASVETGTFGSRQFLTAFKVHTCANSNISYANRDLFTRWYQEDGKTQVFRLFANDENTQSARKPGAARTEAFSTATFEYSDNRTYIWSGRYRVVNRANEGFVIFQAKAPDSSDPAINGISDGWSLQLSIGSAGLIINQRRGTDSTPITGEITGQSFNVEVREDGLNYIVKIDGATKATGSFARAPGLRTSFRWGMYCGGANATSDGKITAGTAVVYVSGATISSSPGRIVP